MSQESNGNGIGILTVTFLVFLVLKLTGVIAWSWWWVTAPLWGGPAVLLVIGAVMVISLVLGFFAKRIGRRVS